jgi:hypothetical protein
LKTITDAYDNIPEVIPRYKLSTAKDILLCVFRLALMLVLLALNKKSQDVSLREDKKISIF